jgi:hypothetical protein
MEIVVEPVGADDAALDIVQEWGEQPFPASDRRRTGYGRTTDRRSKCSPTATARPGPGRAQDAPPPTRFAASLRGGQQRLADTAADRRRSPRQRDEQFLMSFIGVRLVLGLSGGALTVATRFTGLLWRQAHRITRLEA